MSAAYRGLFVDVEACARMLAETVDARTILEVGCGDGQLASPLLASFPDARYEGIDVAPEVGGLFDGDRTRATFRSVDSASYVREGRGPFDLVVLVDVLHHVPLDRRADVVADARSLTRPGGHYAVKDWLRTRSVAHLAAWASDRFLTGDRIAYFGDEDDLRRVVRAAERGDDEVRSERVPPRPNNLLLVHRRAPA